MRRFELGRKIQNTEYKTHKMPNARTGDDVEEPGQWKERNKHDPRLRKRSAKSAQRKLPSQMKNYLNAIAGQASICSLNFRVRNENIYSAATTNRLPPPLSSPLDHTRKVASPPLNMYAPSPRLNLTHCGNQIANRQQQSTPGSQLADSGSSAISAASGTAAKGVPREDDQERAVRGGALSV